MNDSQIFAWDNYDDNPNNMIGVDTIPTQKNATYSDASNGVFTGSLADSFFTNDDLMTVPNVASVIGMEAGEIVYGSKEGMVMVNKTYSFTSWSAETGGEQYGEGTAKIISTEGSKSYVKVLENNVPEWVGRVFYVNNESTGRMQLNDASTDEPIDVWIELA